MQREVNLSLTNSDYYLIIIVVTTKIYFFSGILANPATAFVFQGGLLFPSSKNLANPATRKPVLIGIFFASNSLTKNEANLSSISQSSQRPNHAEFSATSMWQKPKDYVFVKSSKLCSDQFSSAFFQKVKWCAAGAQQMDRPLQGPQS